VRPVTAWTDEQLVKACLQGNEQAWSALIDKYKNLIYSIPINRGVSRDDAAEIFQQVCLKLLAELPEIRDPKCVPAWLIRVTSHACFHWGRREQLYERNAPDSADTGVPSAEAGIDEHLLDIEREQILRGALLQISPRCRQLIHMLFYEEPALPYEDVARKLGLARGSIGFIRMRCLRQLRLRLMENRFL
jgi:RNA polymerase sigma factor (sigma-70 family)